jgi:hypothetical protein
MLTVLIDLAMFILITAINLTLCLLIVGAGVVLTKLIRHAG